jgi:hypothetical protein
MWRETMIKHINDTLAFFNAKLRLPTEFYDENFVKQFKEEDQKELEDFLRRVDKFCVEIDQHLNTTTKKDYDLYRTLKLEPIEIRKAHECLRQVIFLLQKKRPLLLKKCYRVKFFKERDRNAKKQDRDATR